MRFLHFILSHSVFISCCAACLCYQTDVLLHNPHDINVYAFVFFSTLCSYNFYWLLSKLYFARGGLDLNFLKKNISFFIFFICGLPGTLYFVTGLGYLFVHISVAVVLTLLYSLPLWQFSFSKKIQKAGFLKTILLSFTWAYITTVLPAAPVSDAMTMPFTVLFSARFFFMLLLCIIFDMRDVSLDKVHGLHSLATDVPKNKLNILMNVVFALYIITGLAVRFYFGHDAQMIAFMLTGIIIWFVYRMSLKPQGYIFYYFLVDGLMLISALGTYLAAQF